jgi:hypothetical protein
MRQSNVDKRARLIPILKNADFNDCGAPESATGVEIE